jgi:hypothetical protein
VSVRGVISVFPVIGGNNAATNRDLACGLKTSPIAPILPTMWNSWWRTSPAMSWVIFMRASWVWSKRTHFWPNCTLKDKALPKLLSELKSTFHDPTHRQFRYVAAQLETTRPGLAKEIGPLWKPTTLPDTQAQSCVGTLPAQAKTLIL